MTPPQPPPERAYLLDYDGTLVPLAPRPEDAKPDTEILELLRALASLPRTVVHIVSGRTRDSLDAFLGELPLALHAEHGVWSRPMPGAPWQQRNTPLGWKPEVRTLMERFVANTPGSFIEEKTASLAWLYRHVPAALGSARAEELRTALAQWQDTARCVNGTFVVEALARGVGKGVTTTSILQSLPSHVRLHALGDDEADEEMFAALPTHAHTYRIGTAATHARERLPSVAAVRAFLRGELARSSP